MVKPKINKTEIAAEICREFPDAATLTLARMLYKRSPELFNSVEHARSMIRGARGSNGQYHRACGLTRKDVERKLKAGDPFAKLPEPLRHFEHWAVQTLPPARTALLSDLHIPFHDEAAVKAALHHVRRWKAERIILNGDLADFFSCSFWEKDPRKRDLAVEVGMVREFLAVLRGAMPRCEIIYKVGNHEERWERYLSVKAPELLGMAEFRLYKVLHMDRHGVRVIGDRQPVRIGKHLHVVHGHEFARDTFGAPVNAARGLYLRGKINAVCGHWHHTSAHAEKGMDGRVVSTWSTGCLCDLHPDYAPLNKWNHGFATVEFDRDAFNLQNHKILASGYVV